MSISFYMDEHVPSPITEALRRHGVDVLTVQEDGRDGLPDNQVLARAAILSRIVFTQDKDFLRLAAAAQRTGQTFAGIVYAYGRGISMRQCIDELQLIAVAGEPADFNNRLTFLPF